MKTYLELEQIGIAGMYREDMILFVVVKGGDVYKYNSSLGKFNYFRTL